LNSLNDLWTQVLKSLSGVISTTAYNTWFSGCEPVEITPDGVFIIKVENDFKKMIIEQRFGKEIKDALSDLFSCETEFRLLTDEELQNWNETKPEKSPLPEALGFTFENFIVGVSNQIAYASAQSVAKSITSNEKSVYNPLFIYGNSGLGKTHLMLAIGSYVLDHFPGKKIKYVKVADFISEFVSDIRSGKGDSFRSKYNDIDLFLVDDIQFLAGAQQTQTEFFNVFNNIYEAGHQIVITSDRPPKEMHTLEDRLISRFESGILTEIVQPDLETRMAICRTKALQLGLVLDDSYVSYIAENIKLNIRQIEGVVKQLTAVKDIMGGHLTLDQVKNAVESVKADGEYVPTPDIIIRETARYYHLSEEEIKGPSQSKKIAIARHVAIYLIREHTAYTLVEISDVFKRNHATILSSIKKIEDMTKNNTDHMPEIIRDISSNIYTQ